jgi:hypothetical protein
MQDTQSNNPFSEGDRHKFCYVYWEHGPGSQTSIYYLDTPTPLGVSAHRIFRPEQEFFDFINQLKLGGWQEYMSQANQEAYEKWLMRSSALDNRFEHCVLSCFIFTDESQPPQRKDLYRLGERNSNLLTGEMYLLNYDEVLQYLEQEHWEFTHQEEYPYSAYLPNRLCQLRFYKRPV